MTADKAERAPRVAKAEPEAVKAAVDRAAPAADRAAPAADRAAPGEAVTPELELFELEMFGGGVERRFRRMRPEVERMPWASFDPSIYAEDVRVAARSAWTRAAFQEHRTAVACAATLRALVEARAPIDLIALATRFPLDEMVHVELCARMAGLLGGGTDLRYQPDHVIRDADRDLPTLLRCADMVVRFFCVGEALSIPLLRGARQAARHPLAKAVLGRIVRDEAAHGAFGFLFLDWALPLLDDEDRAHLGRAADRGIASIHRLWDEIRAQPPPKDDDAHPLGWMETGHYLELAARSLERQVVAPLRERGIPIGESSATAEPGLVVGLVGVER